MKVFQLIQEKLEILSFSSDESILFNKRTVGCFLASGLTTIFQFVFLFCTAESFMEYTECIYMTTASIVIAINFFYISFNKMKILEFIICVQEYIDSKRIMFFFDKNLHKISQNNMSKSTFY